MTWWTDERRATLARLVAEQTGRTVIEGGPHQTAPLLRAAARFDRWDDGLTLKGMALILSRVPEGAGPLRLRFGQGGTSATAEIFGA